METLFTFHMVFLEHIWVLCEASSLADLPILSFIDKCLGSLILLIKKKITAVLRVSPEQRLQVTEAHTQPFSFRSQSVCVPGPGAGTLC